MKKKDHFIGQCIDYTHDGLGVVKYNSVTVFVKNMIAGETALIEIIKVLKNYCVGRVIEFKDQSLYTVWWMFFNAFNTRGTAGL